jgi:hypothetical protein
LRDLVLEHAPPDDLGQILAQFLGVEVRYYAA